MTWFKLRVIVHIVNEAAGEQGRQGQVVAYCGFGTISPTYVQEPEPDDLLLCKTCVRYSKESK